VESLLAYEEETPADFMRPPDPPSRIRPPEVPDGPDPLIGQNIGSYRIKSVIAAGGMGTVYEAEQQQPRRIVALKVMSRYAASRSARRRFQFESQILAHLRHPNIAQVYEAGMHSDPNRDREGAGTTPGVPYFAMEYIPDAKIITQYTEENKLATRDRLRLFAKVCDAVHHGHQKGVIHRDLKPANILVDPGGEPKVIDFGVARATDSDITLATMQTDIGQLIGTVQYMSPEQCDADPHEIDTRSDVYSLGVVLYELLTGALPYDANGSTIVQAAQIIKERAPEPLSRVDRKLRGDVETITLKALEKDRGKRYQSAAALAEDIRRFLNREPIEARPPTTWTRAVRWAARNPVLTTIAACLVLFALSIAATFASVWYLRSRPHNIWVDEGRREARLLSVAGRILHTWKADRPGGVCLGQLVERPREFGGGKLALIAYLDPDDEQDCRVLRAFDVGRSLTVPVWEGRLRPTDALPDPHGRGYTPEQFSVITCMVADVFPDHPGDEVVAVHDHAVYSQCVVRIYDLRGDVVYQVWCDAVLESCHWMPGARQLVFVGLNGEATWEERGYPGVDDPHARVVFAVQPALSSIWADFLRTEPGTSPLQPLWYRCVFPPEVIGAHGAWLLTLAPPCLSPPGRAVYIRIRSDKIWDAGVGWDIDEFGNEVPKSRIVADNYKRNQGLPDGHPDKLPDPNVFHLAPLPPISSGQKTPPD